MPNPIVTLVEDEMAAFRELQFVHPELFPENDRLYPVPFFGDIRRAEVVTLALNPSYKEFSPNERWPIGSGPGALNPLALTNRLLSYFHSAKRPPNNWFTAIENGMSALGWSYQTNAAHIDVHPFPTKFSREMNQAQKEILARIIQARSADHMISVLALCEQVKLIIVIGYAVPLVGGGNSNAFEFVRDRLTPLAGLVDEAGHEPPLLDGEGYDEFSRALGLRHDIKSFLIKAPRLIFSP